MAGLDMVRGPHWSQILALFGQSGTINTILKHRNQVQLKDKARNLKLFFLKSSTEVPHYLQQVTGELKTRAPSQAARKEAEMLAKVTEDGQAHLNGINALANALQNPIQTGDQRDSQTPTSSQELQSPSQLSQEEFQVVEPGDQEQVQPSVPSQLSSDEQFLQQFMAASATANAIS